MLIWGGAAISVSFRSARFWSRIPSVIAQESTWLGVLTRETTAMKNDSELPVVVVPCRGPGSRVNYWWSFVFLAPLWVGLLERQPLVDTSKIDWVVAAGGSYLEGISRAGFGVSRKWNGLLTQLRMIIYRLSWPRQAANESVFEEK